MATTPTYSTQRTAEANLWPVSCGPMDIFQGAITVEEVEITHFRAHELLTEFFEYVKRAEEGQICLASLIPSLFPCTVTLGIH